MEILKNLLTVNRQQPIHTRRGRELEPQTLSVIPLTPDNYTQFNDLAQSAWPGVPVNAEHDFVAITDHGVSFAAMEVDMLLGASVNLIKPSEKPGSYHLLIHMLGTRKEAQGQGVGGKLMRAAYSLVRSGQLGEQVREVRLTSDPLEAQNVMFYLHHHGMHVNTYKLDAYKTLKTLGAQQHRGLPADRFLYSCEPANRWVNQRELPTVESYTSIARQNPDIILGLGGNINLQNSRNILLVEMPGNIAEIKKEDATNGTQISQEWRNFHQRIFGEAFGDGYTAVDATTVESGNGRRSYIVLMRNFNEKDPRCLTKALASLNHR